MAIITRAAKGAALSHAEMDTNLTDARDGLALQVPKAQGEGIRVDSLGTPSFGWHDAIGMLTVDEAGVNKANMAVFRNAILARQFLTASEAYVSIHMPHDYLMGTDIFFHFHWAQASATVTGGSLTWGAEYTYAKGHEQQAFPNSKLFTIAEAADTTQYMHHITEGALSVSGGSSSQIDTADLEPDGIIHARVYLDSNDLTDSVTVPDPFLFFVDMHYQSTGVATKQKAPPFWT